MKKLYIKPTIEVEQIEASSICAGSPNLTNTGFDGSDNNNGNNHVDNKPTEGDGTDFGGAKGTNTWFLDFDDEY